MEHLWRPSAHRVAREHLKCQPPTEEKAAGASQSRNDSANPLSARVHLALRDRPARMEFQEGMETRELQEHLEEEDLQDHLVQMALQEHQGSMGKTAFLELLGLLEPQARMVQEEFLGNRECQDPKDLQEHQARKVHLGKMERSTRLNSIQKRRPMRSWPLNRTIWSVRQVAAQCCSAMACCGVWSPALA